ncbi:MAG: hypothetical protein AMXMBFR58_11660 [Phycisphaerae bacterium]
MAKHTADHPPPPLVPPLLLKVPSAAEVLQVSPRKLADLTSRGVIPSVKIDGSVRYAMTDLQAYVAGLPRSGGGGVL